MSHPRSGDTVPLHPSSARSDMDEIEDLIRAAPSPAAVLPAARPASPPRASIPVTSTTSPAPVAPPTTSTLPFSAAVPASGSGAAVAVSIGSDGFGPAPDTLTEPVWDTVKRDLSRIVTNLKLVVFPNPFREDPGKALRDWDLWGPFFFIVSLGLILSWSATVKKSEVFAVAFAVLAAGAIVLTQCSTAGWAHHLLPKPQSSWILPVPSRCWGSDLHAEGQCHTKDSCGNGNVGMELLGSLSVHERRC